MKKKEPLPTHLPEHFYTMPRHANTTMTNAALRSILLNTSNGTILACGEMWDICHKSLGAGVQRVFLKVADLTNG